MEFFDRYSGPPPGTVVAENGAVVSAELAGTRGIGKPRGRVIQIRDRVHCLVQASIVTRTFIETDSGVILYDTGEDYADGERALAALRTVTDKPVVAIIYSHNHYMHGTQPFIEEGNDPIIIGHPRIEANLNGAADASDFPEAAPVLNQRTYRQFGVYLPESGPDAPFGATLAGPTRKGSVAATHEASNGEELTVDGLRLQFFTDHIADSDDTLTVWIPGLGLALNNFLWPSIPNFYALRGTGFRDPRSWRDGVLLIRNLRPDYLVSTHARALSGKEKIQSTLESYADAISFLFDQSIRGIMHGCNPDELREFVQLPDYLRELPNNNEGYGEVQYQTPYVFDRIFGWFDNRPEHINPAPPRLAGARIVEGFGGKAAVLAAIDKAIADNEHTWAAELASHLERSAPNDQECRDAKARTLRILAQRARGSIARHFYLSHALELENKITIPAAIPVGVATIVRQPPSQYIDYQRTRLDPVKGAGINAFIALRLTDRDAEHGLHVRRAVCEFVSDVATHSREPDATVAMTHETWARLYTGKTTWSAAIDAGDARVDGDPALVLKFFDLFDQP